MKYVFIVCFLISGIITTNAQNKFVKGYYVTDDLDTVRGYIAKDTEWRYYTSFSFKKSLDETSGVETFTPEDARAFGVDDASAYREYLFPDKDGKMMDGFFKVVVAGKLNLVTANNRYFAVTEKTEIYEITPPKIIAGTSQNKTRELGYLKILMADCPKTNDEWLASNYSENNLKRMFVTYNTCVSPRKPKTFEGPKLVFDAGIQLAPSILMAKPTSETFAVDNVGNSKSITGGIFLSLTQPRPWGGLSLIAEFNYINYKSYLFNSKRVSNTVLQYEDIYMKYDAVGIPLYLRLNRRVFLDFGAASQLILSQDNELRTESFVSTATRSEIRTERADLGKISSTTLGILVGGGVKFKVGSFPATAYVRYIRTSTPSQGDDDSIAKYQTISIGASLALTRHQK